MKVYKCLDCGSDMLCEKLPLWNEKETKWYYVFKCSSCGSEFNHRLTKEEEEEMHEEDKRMYSGCFREYKI